MCGSMRKGTTLFRRINFERRNFVGIVYVPIPIRWVHVGNEILYVVFSKGVFYNARSV